MDDKDIWVAEWQETRESLRYFGNKRFAQLTVFIAASGFLLNGFIQQAATIRLALAFIGILLSILFFIMELSSVRYWNKFAERAENIVKNKVLELELMKRWRPIERTVSGTNATYAVYVITCFLWIGTFILPTEYDLDAVKLVEKATTAMPSFSADKQVEWTLKLLTYDESKRVYDISLVKAGDTEAWTLTLNPKGEILKVSQ
ncbi:MAG: hypothetical protein GY699_08000 [Desulfobacteraceae bacterium]|nr:hypothetical protein [Desulfobacteraceae bacterium]